MESLTKENFWNETHKAYPSEMEKFCKWIDEYKKRLKWEDLFKPGIYSKDQFMVQMIPKFHHLPIALQIGIFLQFTLETGKTNDPEDRNIFEGCKKFILEFFKQENRFNEKESKNEQ